MKLSIIILNYKEKGFVKQCVKGIYNSNIQVPFEVIVVDNNSQADCADMLRERFPLVKVIISKKNRGYAYGNNLGIRYSKGEYIAIINPDVAVQEGIFEKMIRFLEDHPRAGMVGPKLIYPDKTVQASCRRFPKPLTSIYRRTILSHLPTAKKMLQKYLMEDWDHASQRSVDWLFGACLMIRKKVLDEIGLFDERFFLYFEDCDLCRRFWEKGYEVWYLADVIVVHYHKRLSAKTFGILSLFDKPTRIHIISAIKYFKKYYGKMMPSASQSHNE